MGPAKDSNGRVMRINSCLSLVMQLGDKILNALENKVAIIVLVFNLGISELTNCINTIKKSTDIENNIFIINYTNHNIEIDYGDDVFIFDYYFLCNQYIYIVRRRNNRIISIFKQ